MPQRNMTEMNADIREYIQGQVNAGFEPPSSICQSVAEVFCDDADEEVVRPIAQRLIRELIAVHLRQQATWPDVTDCDRLDDTFAELKRLGIVCRHNFSCCGNCGVAEIGDEIQAERKAGLSVIGYAFYHMQDTESAAKGCGLYLNYGSVENNTGAAVQIGQTIVEALKRHGLRTNWNGKIGTRIQVLLDWKRRRPLVVDAE